MAKKMFVLMTMFSMVALTFPALAQEPPPPPPVLRIQHEQIKFGKMGEHTQQSSNFVKFLEKAKSAHNRLALVPVAGNPSEVIYFYGFDNFAMMEDYLHEEDKWTSGPLRSELELIGRQGEDLHESERDMVAMYRPELSYKANVNLPRMRFMNFETIRVRPGRDLELAEMIKTFRGAVEKAGTDERWAVYQAISGAPLGTYYVLAPMKSLGEMDQMMAREKQVVEALGAENMKNLMKHFSETVLVQEARILMFEPRMSYVSQDFAKADPTGFWNSK